MFYPSFPSCIVPAAVAASLVVAAQSSAGVITFDPADGYTVGASLSGQPAVGSPKWEGNGSLYTVAAVGADGGAAQSDPTSPSTFASVRYTPDAAFLGGSTDAAGQYSYGFQLRNDAAPDSQDFSVAHRIYIGQASGGTAIRINIFDNGRIELATGSGTVNVVNVNGANFDIDDATGRFIDVAGVIDFDTDTYTLSFDGVQQTANSSNSFAFNSVGQSTFGQFSFQQGGSGDANARQISIDNLGAAIPEPGSMALLGLSGLLMFRRK